MDSHAAVETELDLPAGARLHPLVTHVDDRGGLAEIFRGTWDTDMRPVQWNFETTHADVLRGVHVHPRHYDYVIVLSGWASIGLQDLRRDSPTEGLAALIPVRGDRLVAITIPPGVAHGFYFHEPSSLVYAMSAYWNPNEFVGCLWSDPGLGIPWPTASAIVSERDAALPPVSAILDLIPPFRPSNPSL
jgi:dTDP-4-dehydrorhamnose 3,5-epimerase